MSDSFSLDRNNVNSQFDKNQKKSGGCCWILKYLKK
jgi:hypothetical protein